MTSSVKELITQPTPQQVFATLLALMQLGGLPATAWDSGSFAPVMLNGESTFLSDLATAITGVAAGGFIDDATGPWLDLLAASLYQEAREPAVFVQGEIVLTDTANAGPFTITPSEIIASDGAKTLLFQNIDTVNKTLPLGGSVTLTVQAEQAGAAYNLANGAITVLLTSLPGVTVSNPVIAGTDSWITQQGLDVEGDDSLKARCKAKWSTLGTGSNEPAYFYNATTVLGVTRAAISEDFVNGIVTVYVAGANGPVNDTVLAAVDAVLQAKRPLTVKVVSANTVASQTVIAGTLVVDTLHDPAATLAAVQVAMTRYASGVPIAGTAIVAKLIEVAMAVPGMSDISLSAPVANPALAANGVFTPLFVLSASH